MTSLVRANTLLMLGLLSVWLSSSAWAATEAGRITHLSGLMFVTHDDGSTRILSVKSEVLVGDELKTEKNTYARIKFIDGGEIVLRPGTIFKVNEYSYLSNATPSEKIHDNIFLSLIKGGMRSVTGLIGKNNPEQFKLKTMAATIGVRGTHFGALLCNDDCDDVQTVTGHPPKNGLHTDTAQGKTIISNEAGSIEVPAGSFSFTSSKTALTEIVPPAQGIQVTMPTSIGYNKSTGKGLGADKNNACELK